MTKEGVTAIDHKYQPCEYNIVGISRRWLLKVLYYFLNTAATNWHIINYSNKGVPREGQGRLLPSFLPLPWTIEFYNKT